MSKKHKSDYFDVFEKQAKIAVEEAELLVEVIEGFTTTDALKEPLDRAHEIEHRGDLLDDQNFQCVAVDFITPIERGDILELSQNLDNVIDGIEEVMQRFYMYDIHYMHKDALEFAKIIRKATKAIYRAMDDFRNFKKSKKLHSFLDEVSDLEEQGDKLYLKAVRELFQHPEDPIEVMVWANLFDSLEEVCDLTEDVADSMGNISLKNM